MKPLSGDKEGQTADMALSQLHYGLYLFTSGTLENPVGMLVSWVSQISGEPPMIMTAVRENRAALPAIKKTGAYCLNLLPSGDVDLLAKLARAGEERFKGLELDADQQGLPVVRGSVGYISCRLQWNAPKPGDHFLLMGEVVETDWQDGKSVMHSSESGHAYLGLR